ncbi:MAG TPA: DUF4385 domain-containing protein [Gammaproteobacteria bacterium]|nr:DUF4385 domain-containing protein [Gammaproteobacteria bacterium]
MKKSLPSYLNFDKTKYSWKKDIDYRAHPEAYKIGKGEQGVLICEPYKSEIVIHWRFKTPAIAKQSSKKILSLFRAYLKENDLVGADMARKFLQMGFTRARRYANYKAGKKYDKDNDYKINKKGTGDPSKAESAQIFYLAWQKAENNLKYKKLKENWKKQFG